MRYDHRHKTTIAVVDSHPHDYALFDPLVDSDKLILHFLTQGRLALRWSQQFEADLWLINVQLVDIPGLDLFEMLASTLESMPVFIVADSYSADDEVGALRLGATKYLCKPAALSWLATLRLPRRLPRRLAREPVASRSLAPHGSFSGLGYKLSLTTSFDDT